MGGLLLLLSVTVECCRYIILFALHVSFLYYKFYFCLRLQFELEIGIANLRLQWLNQCVHIEHWTLCSVHILHTKDFSCLSSILIEFRGIPFNSINYIRNFTLKIRIWIMAFSCETQLFTGAFSQFILDLRFWLQFDDGWKKRTKRKKKPVFSIYFNEKCA